MVVLPPSPFRRVYKGFELIHRVFQRLHSLNIPRSHSGDFIEAGLVRESIPELGAAISPFPWFVHLHKVIHYEGQTR